MAKHNKDTIKQLEKIGNRLRKLRIEKGYTNYEQFAFQHDIARAQYGRYERGGDMRISTLIKVLNALDITLEDFFSIEVKEEKSRKK